jgi:hypothetical protein
MELTEYKGFTILRALNCYRVYRGGIPIGKQFNSINNAIRYIDSVLSVGI